MTTTGADLLVDGLKALGADVVFGLPGTQVVPVFESLRRAGLRVVVPIHELAAGFMAMGYARSSGRPGVLLTIPGPGFTYALTPLAEAKLDAVPLIHITLAPTRGPDGGPGFQAVDQSAVARPLVKEIVDVAEGGAVAAGLARAAALAVAHPQGPVLLQIEERALGAFSGVPAPLPKALAGETADWTAVLDTLRRAERPVVLVTGDVEVPDLAPLLARDRIPVCVTAAARGVVPDDDPWALCFDDQRTALGTLNQFLAGVDHCLVLGGQLSHVATAGFELALPEARMTWVRPRPGAGEGHYPRARRVSGEPAALVDAWRRRDDAGVSRWTAAEVTKWRDRFATERAMSLPEPKVRSVEGKSAAGLFAGVRAALPRNAIVVTDSGLHQALARRHFPVLARRGLIFPSDFQSMGFGIPAGIGARLASPDRPVVVVVGDGGFLMSGFDLLTAVKEQVPVVVVVFNDGQLNLIRLQQIREYGRGHGVSVEDPDFETFAEAAGVPYFLVDGDPAATLRRALEANRPALVEVRLGDSGAVGRLRVKGLVREGARGLLGPFLVRLLKRFIP